MSSRQRRGFTVDSIYHHVPTCFNLPLGSNIFGIISNSFILIFALTLWGITFKHLHSLKNMNIALKAIFHVASFCAFIVLLSNILHSVFCIQSVSLTATDASLYVSMSAYMGLLLCRLMTLVCRLHTTFEGTIYKMSHRIWYLFGILFSVMIILSIISIAVSPFVTQWYGVWIMLAIVSIVYFVAASIAVVCFAQNLLKLAHSSAVSTLNVLHHQNSNDNDSDNAPLRRSPTLNPSQQRFVDMTAKYVLLFIISALSTMITLTILLLEIIPELQAHVTMVVAGIDCAINLICLHLQYKFAKKWYHKSCHCLDSKCKRLVEKQMLKIMAKGKGGRSGYDECPAEDDDEEQSDI